MNLFEQEPQPSNPSYREIPLTQGQVTKVDATRYKWLNQWKWYAKWREHTQSFYAARNSAPDEKGKRFTIFMSREVLGLSRDDPRQADHWNHDTLDNRRENLRPASQSQNQWNAKKRKDNLSGYKGVTFDRTRNKWKARIQVNKKEITIGYFDTPEAAYIAFCDAAKRNCGDFAHLG
jgi:hypothetical protein